MLEIPVSWGELIDKITILMIKSERMADPAKRDNVGRELALLVDRMAPAAETPGIAERIQGLLMVNATLWEIEDDIRECEAQADFGARFVGLARSVYVTNDQRAAIKREINVIMQSDLIEEKSYRPYRVA